MTKADLLQLLDDVQRQVIESNPGDDVMIELVAKLAFVGLQVRKGEIKNLIQLVSHILYVSNIQLRSCQ